MGEGLKKGEKSSEKITAFPESRTVPEERFDESVDQLVKEELMRRADEIEEEINSNPALSEISAPEDLFQKIVDLLKARGEWREEGTAHAESSLPEEELAREAEPYESLSEQDRIALEYGYRMLEKQKEREQKQKKRRRRLQRAGMVAAVFAVILSLGMSSEASRRFVTKAWDIVAEKIGITFYAGERVDNIENIKMKERKMLGEIKEKTGIAPVDFIYLPVGMEFLSYEISDDETEVILSYQYKDTYFYLNMAKKEGQNIYHQVDESLEKKEIIISQQKFEIELFQAGIEEESSYVATFSQDGNYYFCSGKIDYDKMRRILEYLVILEN